MSFYRSTGYQRIFCFVFDINIIESNFSGKSKSDPSDQNLRMQFIGEIILNFCCQEPLYWWSKQKNKDQHNKKKDEHDCFPHYTNKLVNTSSLFLHDFDKGK